MKQGPEALIPEEVPVPQVRPGRSLIRIRAFGLNHSEIFTRQGLSPSVTFPRILGIGCTGEIAETTDPERLPRGQKVVSLMGEMGRAFDGSYAEYALVPNGQIYPAASDLPWEKPAAIPETGYTAYGSIQNLKVEDADHVLVRGATSSVGIAAARLQALFDEIARTHAGLGPAKVFPFSELREAHAWLGSERSGGKAFIVL